MFELSGQKEADESRGNKKEKVGETDDDTRVVALETQIPREVNAKAHL
jgi:hypothetical protein